MSGAEPPAPGLVAFLNAVPQHLKDPRVLDHPYFGRLRLVPMPAPLPSLWLGYAIPFEALEHAQILLEVPEAQEPNVAQEATARALLRGWKIVYLPQMAQLLEEVSARLSARQLTPMSAYDPGQLIVVQMRVPFDPMREPLRLTVRDERTQRYNAAVTWRGGKPLLAEVEDRFAPGCRVIESASIAAG
jgi:hypothetical protein